MRQAARSSARQAVEGCTLPSEAGIPSGPIPIGPVPTGETSHGPTPPSPAQPSDSSQLDEDVGRLFDGEEGGLLQLDIRGLGQRTDESGKSHYI